MISRKTKYTRAEHIRARALFMHHQRAGALRSPPGIIAASINGIRSGLSEPVTRYEHYLPDARRELRRGL